MLDGILILKYFTFKEGKKKPLKYYDNEAPQTSVFKSD